LTVTLLGLDLLLLLGDWLGWDLRGSWGLVNEINSLVPSSKLRKVQVTFGQLEVESLVARIECGVRVLRMGVGARKIFVGTGH
jgi:hypothetical protein